MLATKVSFKEVNVVVVVGMIVELFVKINAGLCCSSPLQQILFNSVSSIFELEVICTVLHPSARRCALTSSEHT